MEPNSPEVGIEAWEQGETEVGVEWCPNLDCDSNYALRPFRRTGVNSYVCTICDLVLNGPTSTILAHRGTH